MEQLYSTITGASDSKQIGAVTKKWKDETMEYLLDREQREHQPWQHW